MTRRVIPRTVLTVLAAVLLLGVAAPATHALAPEPTTTVDAFYELLAREQYADARALLDSLQAVPDHAAWAQVLRTTLIATAAVDFGTVKGELLFYNTLDSARTDLDHARKHGRGLPAPQRAAIFAALGHLMLAEAQWINEIDDDPLGAIGPSGDGYDWMKDAYRLDESRLDALLGIAVYRFFRSHTLKALTWLPFISDDREEALADMRRVADSDHPARHGAATSLAWALIEMERYTDASDLLEPRLEPLGSPRAMLEPLGKAYVFANRWDEGRATYDSLIASIQAAPYLNGPRLAGSLNRAMTCARRQDDWQGVYDYATTGLALPLTDDQWDDLADIRNAFERDRARAADTLGLDE